MSYLSSASMFLLLKKTGLFIIVFLFSTTLLKAQDAIYLKSRWTKEYMTSYVNPFIKDVTPKLYLLTADKKGLWYIERVDDTWVRLKDKDGLYLNVEKGTLEVSAVSPGFFSAHWKLPVRDGHNLIINRWTGVYIHNQYNTTQATKAEPGWYSAQWSMEDKYGKPIAAKDFSLNSYTSFLPNQQDYYKLENIIYDANPVFLDINKKRSSELAILSDYGGDNSGKAWKFTLVSDGWYKISNLKLGGNKVLAIAKNVDGSFYFTLTDFVNYPNQLWRMIQYKDQAFLNYLAENKFGIEKFNSMYYTLVSKQHGLEAIKSVADVFENPRTYAYATNSGPYTYSPFDLFWKVKPVDNVAAIKNIPLNEAEQNALAKESADKSLKIFNDAMLKATPIAPAPFKPPVGRIKGDLYTVDGRNLGAVFGKNETEYTEDQWNYLQGRVGKIPMYIFNNTNFDFSVRISYTDEFGQAISRIYKPTARGKHIEFFLDPLCTFIVFTVTDTEWGREVYRSTVFYRSKSTKIFLDGTVKETKPSFWYWNTAYYHNN